MSARAWAIVIIVLVLLIGLMGYARGQPHHRGDEIGSSLGRGVPVSSVVLS
jgi:hypothetical protein